MVCCCVKKAASLPGRVLISYLPDLQIQPTCMPTAWMDNLVCFAAFWKMYLMLGQLEEQEGRTDAARAVYATGLKRCADCVALWRSAARLEEKAGNTGRARALLEQVTVQAIWCAAGSLSFVYLFFVVLNVSDCSSTICLCGAAAIGALVNASCSI